MSNDTPAPGPLIKQCQQGNPLAWEALVKSYQSRVYGVSYYYLRNPSDAQEATQEVFIKVFNSLHSFSGHDDKFLPWLLSITRNCCVDKLRATKLRTHYESEYEVVQEIINQENETPEASEIQERRKRFMYRVLQEFSETSRDILLLKDIQGLKLEQVADILSLPIGTVKSRSNRARIELAKRMAELEDELPKSSGIN